MPELSRHTKPVEVKRDRGGQLELGRRDWLNPHLAPGGQESPDQQGDRESQDGNSKDDPDPPHDWTSLNQSGNSAESIL